MRIWTTLALLAALLGGAGAYTVAHAYTCTTSCFGNTCTTHCY